MVFHNSYVDPYLYSAKETAMRRVLLLVILVMALGIDSGAQTNQEPIPILISSMQISTEIQIGEQSSIDIDLQFTPLENISELEINFPYQMTMSTVEVDSLVAAISLSQLDTASLLRITPAQHLEIGKTYTLFIHSKIWVDVSEIETGFYQFLFDWNTNLKSDNVTFSVFLPKYASIHYEGKQPSIFPNQATFVSDGQRIGLIWTDLSNTGTLNTKIFVEFELSTAASSSSNLVTTIIIVLLSSCLIVLGFLYYKTRKAAVKDQQDESITRVISQIRPMILSPQELEILEMIASYNGGILQSDLVDALNYSRARVSQYLSSFEEKGLITKHKAGRQNYITIASDVHLKPKNSDEADK